MSFTLEPLEARLMLSADLTGVVVAHTLLDPSVPINSEAATVRILNQGDTATNQASQVAVYASLDQVLDTSDRLLGTANAPKRIGAGRSADVDISFAIPGVLEPGSYTLLGRVDATNVIAESSETNNLAIGPAFAVIWQFGAVPGRTGETALTLTDAGGTQVAFSLTGAGLGEVIRDGNQWDIRLAGTGAQTILAIQTSGGNGRVTIDDIHVLGPVGAVVAPTTNLTGTLAMDGPVTAGILLGSTDGAVIAAPTILGTAIQGVTVQGIAILGDLSNSTILIGANLGQDGELGGSAANADNFGAGTLGDFFVGGSMTASVVRVGQDPVDGIFDNGNDAIQGGTGSSIRSITIHGTLSADSRFIAGALPATARINSQTISTASNPVQFKTDVQGPVLAAALGTDTGVSSNDGLTSNPTIVGSLTDPHGIAAFVAGFTATPTFDVLADRQADGSFTFSRTRLEQINGAPLTDGSYVLTLRAADTAGNPRQITVPFTLDTMVTTLVFDLDPASDTPPVGDQQTTAAAVTLTGQTEANAAVELLEVGLPTTADATGLFTFTNVSLAMGANTFTSRAMDTAGNQLTATRTIARTPATTVSWINPNGGDWNTPSNWNTGALPTADQDVFLDIDVTNPITHSAGATQVKSLISTQRLTLSGGTLIITGTLQADNLVSFTGGSVVTTGDQIYNGAVVLGANTTLSGNNITFSNTVNSDGTARSLTVNSNNGSFTLGGEVGTTSALSRLSATGNVIVVNGNVNTTADINLTSAGLLTLNANVTAGTGDVSLTAAGGAISHDAGTITAGALVLTANQVTSTLTTAVGSLTASTSAGNLTISNVGSLSLNTISSPNGTATITTSGNLVVNGNVATGASAMSLVTGGAISQTGGTVTAGNLTLAATTGISLTNIAVTSLTATNTTGAVSIGDAGGLTLTAVSVGGRVAITTSGNLVVNGTVTSGPNAMSLTATGGAIIQTAGTVTATFLTLSASIGISLTSAAIDALEATNISGAVSVHDLAGSLTIVARGVTNGGAVSITTPGNLTLTSSVTASGSIATLTSTTGTVAQAGGTVNATSLVLNTATGATLTNLAVTNLTATNSTSGALSLSTTGAVTVVGTGIVNPGGVITLGTPGSITISGDVNPGTSNVTLTSTNASISQTGGLVTGGRLDLDAATGIVLTATAVSTLDATNSTSGALSVSHTGALSVDQVSNVNRPVTVSASGNLVLTGTVSGNPVTLLSGGSIVRTTGAVVAATLNTASVTGTTLTAGLTISNLSASNSGVGNIVIAVPASLTIIGPGLSNAGGLITLSVTGNLTNQGTLSLGAGVTIIGNFINTASGVVHGDIGGTAQFSHLTISGMVSLNGTLDVSLVNGFVPSAGDRFQFMTFSSRTGFFSTTTLPANFTVDQSDPTDLELVVV